MNPKLILLDEPVSALDVSIQAQVINLLDDLQDDLGLSYVFVAHDLSVVRHVSDRIAVMYLGKIMELSPSEELYTKPIHPYSSALLAAIPIPDPKENRERDPHEGDRRGPEPDRPAKRLPLRRPLPARDRRLPSDRAAADRVRRRPPRRLPSPAVRDRRGDRGGHALAAEPAELRRSAADALSVGRRPCVTPESGSHTSGRSWVGPAASRCGGRPWSRLARITPTWPTRSLTLRT